MNGDRKSIQFASVVAMVTLVAVGLANPATAGETEAEYVETDAIVNAIAIQSMKVRGDIVRARAVATSDPGSQRLGRRLTEYLDAEAKQGRFHDERRVFAATMDNPLLPGRPITVVWADQTAPLGIHLHKIERRDGGIKLGMNLATAPPLQVDGKRMGPSSAPTTPGSSGFAGVTTHPNMYKEAPAQPCTTYWFRPEIPTVPDANGDPTEHQMNSCWEIWAQNNTVHFEYNRWAVWTLARPSSRYRVWTQDFSILSRPWRNSTAISSLVDSTYPSGQSSCDTRATVTIGGTYGGLTGQISIPVYQCTTTWRHFDTGRKMFGMDWDGFTENRQLRLDAAGRYNAVNKTVLPVWADQTYVSTYSCYTLLFTNVCSDLDFDRGWKFQDTGW